MSKEELKTKMTVGGAFQGDSHHREITQKQNNKGITLIALIITIIVMLILVGVTVTVALNGGLFTSAKDATNQTQIAIEREQLLEAMMGAIGNDGKVYLVKLDSNLPNGFEATGVSGTYKNTKSGNVYTVTENGVITLKVEEENLPAEPEKVEYTVTFYNDDEETILATVKVYEGENVTYPYEDPESSVEQSNSSFNGWKNSDGISVSLSDLTIDSDINLYAYYSSGDISSGGSGN